MFYNNTDTVYTISLITDFNMKFQSIYRSFIMRSLSLHEHNEEHFCQTFTLNIIVNKTIKKYDKLKCINIEK